MNFLAITLGEGKLTLLVAGMIAWFLQMGFHEGGHAWAAYWLGDKTAYYMGKRTVNPFRHIEWRNPSYVITAVVMPAITVLTLGFPLGMAWVPVNPSNFRHPTRDHAIVAVAGPLGGFLVAAIVLGIWIAVYPLFGSEPTMAMSLLQLVITFTYITAVIYSVFNLVPVPPLDGSNVVYHFGNESMRSFMDKIRPYGFFIVIALFWILPGGVLLQPFYSAMIWPFANLPEMIWGQ